MATPTTTTKNVYSASLVTIHSDRAFDDVLSSLYSQVGLPGSDQDEVGDHGFLMDQHIDHGAWMRHLGFSDGLKYKRVSLANPGFAVRLSRIYPRAGLAFPFDLLILEEQGGGVELVFYLPSVLIMTLIKNWELNHTLMELDWRLTALVQFVASWSVSGVANGGQQNGGYEDRRHENGGHESGDQQNGGHENGGHENGGYENGGYENGGHESGEQQNGGYENGGHENGHGSGGLQNERHEKRRHRSQTSAGHEFGPRGNDGEEHEEHQNEESEDEGYQNKRRRTVAGFEIDRFRPQREEIEASRVTGDA